MMALCAYLTAFFFAIVGGKLLIARLLVRYGHALSGPLYRGTMRLLGGAMVVFAIRFVWDACTRLGWMSA